MKKARDAKRRKSRGNLPLVGNLNTHLCMNKYWLLFGVGVWLATILFLL